MDRGNEVRYARRLVFVVLSACLSLLGRSATAQPNEPLIAAASGEHLWFVQATGRASQPWELCHHSTAMHGTHYRAQLPLEQLPTAMAAWEDRLWLVFENDAAGQRDVFTIRIQRLSRSEPYFQTTPVDRMELAPALPSDGYLCGLVGTAEGPVALLAAVKEHSAPQRLLQLRGGEWADLPLAAGAAYSADAELTSLGRDGRQIAVVIRRVDQQPRITIDRRDVEGMWRTVAVDGIPGRLRAAVGHGDQVVVLTDNPDGREWRVTIGRPNGSLQAGVVAQPRGACVVVEFNGGVQLLSRAKGEDPVLQRVLLPQATLDVEMPLTRQPPGSRSIWAMAIVFAAVVGGVLVVLVLRPGSRQPVKLEAPWQQLSVGSRLLALVFDALPAAIVTVMSMDVQPADLARIPLMSPDFADSWPYIVMVLLTVGHSGLSELAFGRSLGLMFVEGAIRTTGGAPASGRQILLRNLVKLLILVIPPLAVFALVSPNLQGLHDSLSRTVVAHKAEGDGEVREKRENREQE